MDASTDYRQQWPPSEQVSASDSVKISWTIMLSAIVVTLVAVYLGFVRPASLQLATMQRQVTRLERSIQKLTGEAPSAERTLRLMELLAQQGRRGDDAEAALVEMETMTDQLIAQGERIEQLMASSHQLARLQAEIDQQVRLLHAASRALKDANQLQSDLIEAGRRTAEAHSAMRSLDQLRAAIVDSSQRMEEAVPVVAQVFRLCRSVIDLYPTTRQAQEATEQMAALHEELLCRSHDLDAAHSTLDQLVYLQDRLDCEGDRVAKAHDRLTELVDLKDYVLLQTEDLVDAVETLELLADLRDEYQRAAASFQDIRQLMVEVVLLEPTVNRAMTILRPMTELVSLRRMSAEQLRDVVQQMKNEGAHEAVAEASPAEEVAAVPQRTE